MLVILDPTKVKLENQGHELKIWVTGRNLLLFDFVYILCYVFCWTFVKLFVLRRSVQPRARAF